jgi:uncharacterized protein (TIGR03083 family)
MQSSRREVMAVVETLSDDEVNVQTNGDGWTVKDILAHMARWEGELVTLMWQLEQGQPPDGVLAQDPIPVDEVNQAWFEADRDRPLSRVLDDLRGVRRQTENRLAAFSDDELEREDLHPKLRGIALWHRIAANTFEHDAEHLPDLRSRVSDRDG